MEISYLNSKNDFYELLFRMLDPLKPYYSKGKAYLDLGVTATIYEEKSIWMEAFSRPLWALVPFFAGGGSDKEFEDIYIQGLMAGTDTEGNEYWGGFRDYDQKFVEMAALAYGILLAPDKLWEPLPDKERLAKYLYGINEYHLPCCNWLMFNVLVNITLKRVGMRYDAQKLEQNLQQTESFYLGDGWYQDGDSGQKDYYVSFAIHFYSLIYAKCMEKEDPERSRRFKERACEFAKQFIYWFDDDGEALPFGRSLTYRFAQVSFFSACLLAGIEPYSVAEMKGLIVRHLQYWMSCPIFDREGILTIGYTYPNLVMAERYNGPGSPYWGMKVFAFLALPDDHPFWSEEAAPMPALKEQMVLPHADMLIHRYPGHVTAFVPGRYSPYGHGQIVAKYGKFAYDTKFGFSMAKSSYELHENCPDSMLAFKIDGYVYVRRICEEFTVRENEIYSKWVPKPGITVETTIVPTKEGYIRTHRIHSDTECEAYDCGFAVSANDPDGVSKEAKSRECKVANRFSYCEVVSEEGSGKGEIIGADPNTNLLHPKTLIPSMKYRITKGENLIKTVVIAGVTR